MNNALIEMSPIAARRHTIPKPFHLICPLSSLKIIHNALCLCVQTVRICVSVFVKIQTEKWDGFNSELQSVHFLYFIVGDHVG